MTNIFRGVQTTNQKHLMGSYSGMLQTEAEAYEPLEGWLQAIRTIKPPIKNNTGLWFGTFFLHTLRIIIPIDFHIFLRGRYTTDQKQYVLIQEKDGNIESTTSHVCDWRTISTIPL